MANAPFCSRKTASHGFPWLAESIWFNLQPPLRQRATLEDVAPGLAARARFLFRLIEGVFEGLEGRFFVGFDVFLQLLAEVLLVRGLQGRFKLAGHQVLVQRLAVGI